MEMVVGRRYFAAAVEYSRLRFLRKAPVLSREARAYYATPSGANRHLCRGRGFFLCDGFGLVFVSVLVRSGAADFSRISGNRKFGNLI